MRARQRRRWGVRAIAARAGSARVLDRPARAPAREPRRHRVVVGGIDGHARRRLGAGRREQFGRRRAGSVVPRDEGARRPQLRTRRIEGRAMRRPPQGDRLPGRSGSEIAQHRLRPRVRQDGRRTARGVHRRSCADQVVLALPRRPREQHVLAREAHERERALAAPDEARIGERGEPSRRAEANPRRGQGDVGRGPRGPARPGCRARPRDHAVIVVADERAQLWVGSARPQALGRIAATRRAHHAGVDGAVLLPRHKHIGAVVHRRRQRAHGARGDRYQL